MRGADRSSSRVLPSVYVALSMIRSKNDPPWRTARKEDRGQTKKISERSVNILLREVLPKGVRFCNKMLVCNRTRL